MENEKNENKELKEAIENVSGHMIESINVFSKAYRKIAHLSEKHEGVIISAFMQSLSTEIASRRLDKRMESIERSLERMSYEIQMALKPSDDNEQKKPSWY